MSVRILTGCARDRLRDLPDASVHTIVTSPPYFGLRDYGVPGQIGLEPTPDAYVASLVEVFRECRRVLRDDGTVWLNLGDSYATSRNDNDWLGSGATARKGKFVPPGLKPKDLIGIPWRVAFALQADGWYLRSDIIWAKSNPMPESVTDRPTSAHEHIFLLSKRERYYYDAEAVKEVSSGDVRPGRSGAYMEGNINGGAREGYAGGQTSKGRLNQYSDPNSRNLRNVWTVATQPFSDWGETVRRVRVEADALDDGKKRITSPDCPLHGDRSAPASKVRDGGRVTAPKSRTGRSESHPVLGLFDGCAPTETRPELATVPHSSGLPLPECSASATSHNNESHRTDPAPETSFPYIVSAQIPLRIPDTSEAHGLSGLVEHTPESKNGQDETDESRSFQIPADSVHTLGEQASSGASHGSTCTCEWYVEVTEKTSHFATFPPALIEPCIKAGCPEKCCPHCGAGWERVREQVSPSSWEDRKAAGHIGGIGGSIKLQKGIGASYDFDNRAGGFGTPAEYKTIGFRPTCSCPAHEPIGGTVLDCFGGAGTTGLVADRLGRNAILIELNEAYAAMSERRIYADLPMFAAVTMEAAE
jgi:DNA modification methylase